MSSNNPACAGRWQLFDSTDISDHAQAAQICATCPALDWCIQRTDEMHAAVTEPCMVGTWAGRLYGIPGRRIRSEVTPEPRAVHMLIACGTCGARVGETCIRGTRADGSRARGRPHVGRVAPRLCGCGALLGRGRQLCDHCANEMQRASKRDYMRRVRAAGRRSAA